MSILKTEKLVLGYGKKIIINRLNLEIPKNEITVFVGANGSGKSTLLRALARLLKPKSGEVFIHNQRVRKLTSKQVAKQLAILPQGPIAPEGLTVLQLVKQGRYPHQSWFNQWSKEDEQIVEEVLRATQMDQLKDRPVNALSGGQRQRAWIAMSLVQKTDIILLDEPTTYLDLAHQIDILDLLFELNEREKRTIVMVLHDLNLACRYAHNIVAINNQQVYCQGRPEEVVTSQMVKDVFNMECLIGEDEIFGTPVCIPHGKGRMVKSKKSHLKSV